MTTPHDLLGRAHGLPDKFWIDPRTHRLMVGDQPGVEAQWVLEQLAEGQDELELTLETEGLFIEDVRACQDYPDLIETFNQAEGRGQDESPLPSELPPAPPRPCNDCPWRVNSAPGWLGPHSAAQWTELARSDEPIACHQTIDDRAWQTPGAAQCRGAALYRRRICKQPKRPDDAALDQTTRQASQKTLSGILSGAQAFEEHHR